MYQLFFLPFAMDQAMVGAGDGPLLQRLALRRQLDERRRHQRLQQQPLAIIQPVEEQSASKRRKKTMEKTTEEEEGDDGGSVVGSSISGINSRFSFRSKRYKKVV